MFKYNHHRIWIVTGISLLLHLLVLLAWWMNKPQTKLVVEIPASQFSVSLQTVEIRPDTHKPARTAPAKTEQAKTVMTTQPDDNHPHRTKIVEQTSGKMDQAEHVEAQSNNMAHTDMKAVSENIATTQLEKTSPPSISRAQIISRLHKDLQQYFYYPPLAQRKNIQGTVTLGFAITHQGLIHDIQVIKSSGFAILDLAAEDALQQIKHVDWIHDRITEDNIDIELPVRFILTER